MTRSFAGASEQPLGRARVSGLSVRDVLVAGIVFIVAGALVEPDNDVLRNADLRTVCFAVGGILLTIDTVGRRRR